jgi:hypothetical protein
LESCHPRFAGLADKPEASHVPKPSTGFYGLLDGDARESFIENPPKIHFPFLGVTDGGAEAAHDPRLHDERGKGDLGRLDGREAVVEG